MAKPTVVQIAEKSQIGTEKERSQKAHIILSRHDIFYLIIKVIGIKDNDMNFELMNAGMVELQLDEERREQILIHLITVLNLSSSEE